MSLSGSLQIGRSALLSSQAALQVAGDNMANAATPGFHRRTVHMSPTHGNTSVAGHMIGQGVQITAIRREIDTALQMRFRNSVSAEHANVMQQRFLTALESIQNELTDNDLSTLMSTFFNNFSELANNPNDAAMRGVAIQQGQTLADRLASLRGEYGKVHDEISRSLDVAITQADDLLDRIAMLNGQIANAEVGNHEAAALRDQRDMLLDELSQFMDFSVIEQSNGSVDVLVGSTPVVLGNVSRGVELRNEQINGQHQRSLRVKADGTLININSGTIGGLLKQQQSTVGPAIDTLDELAAQLIFQVNRLHSQGQSKTEITSATGTYSVANPDAALNSDAAKLPFQVENGSFFIHVTHGETGVRTAHEIMVNGSMSLDDVVGQINTVVGVPHVTAAVTPASDGSTLQLTAEDSFSISFSDDTSGALAVLGINTFFTGQSAATIDVNQTLKDDPSMLAAGGGHVPGSNETALGIAKLQDASIQELGGKNLREYWQSAVSDLGVKLSAANGAVESSRLVRENLDAQVQAVSGVSLDEESINLLMFQRQFQAAARYISVIDETMQILINL